MLHHCDNTLCVRPDHLFLGTHQDNNDDMLHKGRNNYQRIGEENTNAKLSRADVLSIRERLNGGEAAAAIARSYPVTPAAVSRIKLRKSWGWL